MPHELPVWLTILLILNRWAHLVAMTLLVGGILFFEFVLPAALEDLKDEQRMAVFGRARWVFRKVIWVSLAGLIVSGLIISYRMWPVYTEYDRLPNELLLRSRPWAIAHLAVAVLGLLMALRLTSGRHLLKRPVRWMQMTLIVLFIAIFLGGAARYLRQRLHDIQEHATHASRHESA